MTSQSDPGEKAAEAEVSMFKPENMHIHAHKGLTDVTHRSLTGS
jgi:hypothetical protein